jgi:hypothetical protein
MQVSIAVVLVVIGLCTSAFYGFADYILQADLTLDTGVGAVAIDATILFQVAVGMTAILIAACLLWAVFDDEIWQKIRLSRISARAEIANREMDIKASLLKRGEELTKREKALREQHGNNAFDNADKIFRKPRQVMASEVDSRPTPRPEAGQK